MGSVIAKLVAVLVVAAGAPALAAGSAQAAPGATPQDPVVLTSLSQLPAGAVVVSSTLDQCATVTTWSVTTPAVVETTRDEYRWPLDVRTYTPAVEEESHQIYSYKKTVQDYKTQWFFAKYTRTKTRPPYGNWSAYGPWTKWEPETHTSWEDSQAPLGVPLEHGSGTYSNGTQWYREWQARSTGITRSVPNGSHLEYSGETLTTLGAPWVLLPGYPKKVVDVDAVPASFGAWTFDSLTDWSSSSAAPADPDGQSGEDNPLNLRRVGTPMEARTLGNGDAVPAKVTYYRYSDGKVCEPIATPPPPPTTAPPTPTPPPVVEVLGEQVGRATGKLNTSCQRTVRVTMKNASAETVAYKIKVGKKTTMKTVKADSTRVWTTTGQHRDLAKLMLGTKVLAMKRVPKPCVRPEVLPDTGKRQK